MPADVSPLGEQVEQELDQLADALLAGDPDDPKFNEIHDAAGKWVANMFENHPEKVPPTFAVKLYLDGLKMKAAKEVPPDPTGEDERSILDNLDALPKTHARKILQREIDRVRGELARYEEAMEGLK